MTQSQPSSRTRMWAVFLIVIVILIIVWLLITRGGTSAIEVSTTPTAAPATILSPAPSPIDSANLNILFSDNFDHSAGDWELSPANQAQYVNGVMYLGDTELEGAAWSRPHLRFQDFVLDVDSRWLGGSVGGTYGLRFRLDDADEYLAFYLHNDGWYNVIHNQRNQSTVLHEALSQAVNHAGEANHIHIEAQGERFRFFVNGTYLVDVQVAAPESGDIMFVAEKVEGTDEFRVGFDNLVIGLHPPP